MSASTERDLEEDGFIQAAPSQDYLVGQTLNLRWFEKDIAHFVGGVFIISKIQNNTFFIRSAPYRGSNPGHEEPLKCDKLYYDYLSERQKKCFIPPNEKRVRPDPPPSLCPKPPKEGNYPIIDPNKSFLSKNNLNQTQIYLVHDNGGRPFKVIAHKNAIELYVDADEPIWDEKPIYNKRFACYTEFLGLWPGYDSANYDEFDEDKGKETANANENDENEKDNEDDENENENDDASGHGANVLYLEKGAKVKHCCRSAYGQTLRQNHNSLLIQLTKTKYVFVGQSVYSFSTDQPIVNFFSPLGNNDVPYPVAYGEDNTYFMLDCNFIKNTQLKTPKTCEGSDNIYREFYKHIPHFSDRQVIPMKDLEIIHKRLY